MDIKVTHSRTSSRLAEKRRHFGKFDCPCCVKKSRTNSIQSASSKQKTFLSENVVQKRSSAVRTNKDVYSNTQDDTAPVKRKRGRPPKRKTDNSSRSYQKNTLKPGSRQDKSLSHKDRTATGRQVSTTGEKSQRKAGDATSNISDARVTNDDAHELMKALFSLKTAPCSDSDKFEIFDAVAAVLNDNSTDILQRMSTSWEKELTGLCPVQLVVYSHHKILISDSIRSLSTAKDTLTRMLEFSVENVEKSLPAECSNHNCPDIEASEANSLAEENASDNTQGNSQEVDSDNSDASHTDEDRGSRIINKITKYEVISDTKITDDDEVVEVANDEDDGKVAMRNLRGISQPQTSSEIRKIIENSAEDNTDLTDPHGVCVSEMGLAKDEEDSVLHREIKNQMTKDGPMSREALIELIDNLEAGLLTEDVDPAEIWKLLTKPYTRSERTNKKEVAEDELILCDLCNEYRGTEAGILSHKRRRHPKVIYRCDLCNKAFGVKYACLMHRVSHLGRGRWNEISKVLRLERQKQEAEVKHINMERMTENITRAGNSTLLKNPEKALHKCKYCNYRGTHVGVTSHTLRYHPKRVYKCDECSRTYGTKYQMDVHKESHAMRRLREKRKKEACHALLQPKTDGSPICLPDEYKHIHKCDICGFMTTKSALVQHKHRHHQEKLFQCDLCNKWFSRRCEFNSHRLSHFDKDGNLRNIRKVDKTAESSQKEENLELVSAKHTISRSEDDSNIDTVEGSKCVDLLDGVNGSENLEKPKKNAEDSKLCKCDICGFETTHEGLQVHKKRQHRMARHECDICCKRFCINSILQKHRSTHFTDTGELKPWLKKKCGLEAENLKCEECNVVFKSSRSMEIHVAKKHKKTKKYMCEFCLYRGFTKNDVDIHVTRMHKSHDHKCDKCGKAYAFAKELERHLAVVHQGTEQCKCHICGQEFKMIRYLKNHLERHEGNFRCYCTVCGKGFMDNCRLKEHEQTHKPTAERDHKYHCDICQKGFLRRSTWQQHMDCHYKNRCHTCDLCGKAFTLPQTLWKHKLRHKSERPYPCDYPGCTKAFFDKTTFQYHYVTHTGQSAHKCNTCGKVFTQAATLRRHVCKMAVQHFRDEINDVEAVKSVSDLASICPKSDNVISVIGSAELDSGDQTIVLQPEQLALLNQLESSGQVIQVVDNPGSVENVMIIVNGSKQESDAVQQMDVQQEGGTRDEVIDPQLTELMLETSKENYVTPPSETSRPAELHQELEPSESRTGEVESQQYLCSICKQLFSSWNQIKSHMILHTGEDSQMMLSVVDPMGNVAMEEMRDVQLTEAAAYQEQGENKQ